MENTKVGGNMDVQGPTGIQRLGGRGPGQRKVGCAKDFFSLFLGS